MEPRLLDFVETPRMNCARVQLRNGSIIWRARDGYGISLDFPDVKFKSMEEFTRLWEWEE